ncbi:PAX3- and PAX7-binding protein 1 [Ciona intestinalis]
MFKKSNKSKLRKRRNSLEEDEDLDKKNISSKNNQTENVVNPKTEKVKKSKKPAAVSLLSFDDEEGESEIQLKKSSRSKRIAKKIKKRTQEEKEAELNPQVAQIKPSKFVSENAPETHIFRPKAAAPEVEEKPRFKPHTVTKGAIPSPSMIHAARKQREMLRKFGSEFIPVDDTQTYKENKSRLVREDDYDNSSDDEIIEMKGIKSNKSIQSNKYVPNESEESEDGENNEENVDEEVNRWEEEMIKKGRQQIPGQPEQMYLYQAAAPQPAPYDSYGYAHSYYAPEAQNPVPVNNVEAKSNLTFEIIKKRLSEHLVSAKEVHRSHKAEMDSIVFDTKENTEMSKQLTDNSKVSDEYRFYQEMKDYVKNLVACLREKVPNINNMEKSANVMWKTRSENLIGRRIQDVRDESSKFMSGKAALEKGNLQDAGLTQRVREREARRTRRRADRQIKKNDGEHHDGCSSDDEVTSMEEAKISAEISRLQKESSELFNDVVDEFCEIKCILKHFETWRSDHSDSYNDAYIALCIPKLLVPFIRFETLLWNPLNSDSAPLEQAEWFKTLSWYGMHCIDDVGDHANMDDTKVLANLFEKVILQKLVQLIKEVWDPLSTFQTVNLVSFMNNLSGYPFMASDNRHCQQLVQAICTRFQNSLNNDVYIPLLPSSVKTEAAPFLERQTWSSIKLFKNALLLHEFLSYEAITELAFDSLLNRYIILALQTCPLSKSCLLKCKEIVSTIPRDWFAKYPDLLCHLSTLTRFLEHFSKSVASSSLPADNLLKKKVNILLLEINSKFTT